MKVYNLNAELSDLRLYKGYQGDTDLHRHEHASSRPLSPFFIIVSFKATPCWQKDPAFPESLRRKEAVKPRDITPLDILDPQKEDEAYRALKAFVESFGIRVETRASKVAGVQLAIR